MLDVLEDPAAAEFVAIIKGADLTGVEGALGLIEGYRDAAGAGVFDLRGLAGANRRGRSCNSASSFRFSRLR